MSTYTLTELEPSLCEVKACDYFDLDKTMLCGQIFKYIRVSAGFYILQYKHHYTIAIQNAEDILYFACSKEDVETIWAPYLDLARNYDEEISQLQLDPFAQASYDISRGIHIINQDPWEMCISYIISQRNKIEHISAIVQRISQEFGTYLGVVEGFNLYTFPTPEQLKDATIEDLRDCSVGFRDRYLKSFIRYINQYPQDIEEWRALSHDSLVSQLQCFEGIGPKVANCISLFGYHHLEAFPIDLWIQRIISGAYKNNLNPTERFGTMAGVIQQYMFNYVRNHGGNYNIGG